MSLHRLLYCSRAIPNLSYQDLKDILEKSEKNNSLVGITGMLCYGNSMFLQVLEGSRQNLTQTYNRIARDARHMDAELIDFSEAESRQFQIWSMKVVELGTYAPEKMQAIYLKYASEPTFSPQTMNPRQCLNFLLEVNALYNADLSA